MRLSGVSFVTLLNTQLPESLRNSFKLLPFRNLMSEIDQPRRQAERGAMRLGWAEVRAPAELRLWSKGRMASLDYMDVTCRQGSFLSIIYLLGL